tara:strand:+ start:6973 stop:7257 length:285 start_codon:yes stop_codon:yes gene_type:complete
MSLNKYQFNYNQYGEIEDYEDYKKCVLLYLVDSETQSNHSFCPKCEELVRSIFLDNHLSSSKNCIKKLKPTLKKPKKIELTIKKDNCITQLDFS